ncbi:MAG: hypothetical protein AAGG51_28525 [Cyanobacteria bacterium P01_G01_bin.54]
MQQSRRLIQKALPILVFILPFSVNYGFVIDYFYRCQAPVLDAGLYAGLLWKNSWALLYPSVVGPAAGVESFLHTHMMPIYWFASALSYVLPLNMVQTVAFYIGLACAVPAIASYVFLIHQFKIKQPGLNLLWIAILSLLFAFNGITQAIIGYPHPEVVAIALLISFLLLWASQKYGWALLPFSLCLMVREDLGFHIVAILGLVLLLYWRESLRFWQSAWASWTVLFASIAMLYSCGALAAQDLLFPGGQALFQTTYLGIPPYAHISAAFLWQRLSIYLTTKQYVYWPAIATVMMALYPRRRLALLIGFAAYLPWFMVHFLAVTEQAGLLIGYYAYPFVVSLAWPLIYPWLNAQQPTAATQQWAIKTFAVGIIVSIVGGWISPVAGTIDLSHFLHHANVRAFNAFTAAVEMQQDLGQVYIDESVAALMPTHFQRSERLLFLPEGQPVETLLYCEPSLEPEKLQQVTQAQSFEYEFEIQGTPLKLKTNLDPQTLESGWSEILEPVD